MGMDTVLCCLSDPGVCHQLNQRLGVPEPGCVNMGSIPLKERRVRNRVKGPRFLDKNGRLKFPYYVYNYNAFI